MIRKKVLVVPLDWGLGHASRCIPVIRELLKQQCEVQLGGSGKSAILIRSEFPQLKCHDFPAYAPVYPKKNGSMLWTLVRQLPRFISTIRQEHIRTRKLVLQEGIDLIISDNRYGVWAKEIPSVLITHQLNILPPRRMTWLRPFLRLINYRFVKKFTVCLIPDLPGRVLTGDLTLPFKKIPVIYCGILSRFSPTVTAEQSVDLLVILSGPEPQRSIFEDIVLDQLRDYNKRILLVRGMVGEQPFRSVHAQLEVVNSLATEDLHRAIAGSNFVIARSGYSTIMDLSRFGVKSILIPTPGQTEQRYLAKKLHKKGIIYSCEQKHFQLQHAINKAGNLKGSFPENDVTLLATAIHNLLNS